MKKQWWSLRIVLLSVSLLVVILSSSLSFHLPTAHAASNGQVLQVTCAQATLIAVTGKNQNGDTTTHTFSPDSNGDGSTFTTTGYWWVGPITIWYYGTAIEDVYFDSVPQQQDGDIYSSNCSNPPAQYNSSQGTDSHDCDPNTTSSPSAIRACLEKAPDYASGWPSSPPFQPFLTSVTTTDTINAPECVILGIDGNGDSEDANNIYNKAPLFGDANDGTATVTKYIWGYSYRDANGLPSYELYQNGDGPLLVIGSTNVNVTCNQTQSGKST